MTPDNPASALPTQLLREAAPPTVDDLVEAMLAWTNEMVGTDEIVVAKEQFYVDAGKVFHDDTVYDARTSYFFDHFLFERPLPAGKGAGASARMPSTPYELFQQMVRAQEGELPQATIQRVTELGDFRHSLYQITRLSERTLVVQDLVTPAKIPCVAKAGETFRGLEKGQMFQGFLFKLGGQTFLSQGLVLHPARAQRLVRAYLKKQQKSGDFSRRALLFKLAHVQIRYLRHRHVDPKTIYAAELK